MAWPGCARLSAPRRAEDRSADAGLPLLDVVVAGEGRSWSGGRYCESEAGYRFRYVGHDGASGDGGPWRELRVDLDDPVDRAARRGVLPGPGRQRRRPGGCAPGYG